ncbi:MAG: hypothetical protein IPO45_17110 [Saprospiraceae bacterium]|jgi:hypothetical protein|uniref:hypothetical protein n=1 Tax=Candidatus Brachybacter algidus TaxID=2982024 RepID=UPI001B4F3359|nr:hypothetical protein [Candidatus Brachybacter algidus]MBP7305295.1 hypothetical protein [Saprospiraceae bacterium]MBK6450055.1 hypothetical protein [Candidatus Brachybacter algidus]MBK7604067.1 hypothetical protein [Candidatus Brachybacter algidus]MBK8353936.1 hypothetical protein [Candidatus Brachybacter algidus]MBK8603910.1 hypothetical protein [Candidatus Brachybacter algidus]
MSKNCYILLLILNLVLSPGVISACGSGHNTEEKSCSVSEKEGSKSCCSKKKVKSDSNSCCGEKNKGCCSDTSGCNGKCKNSSCKCPNFSAPFTLPAIQEVDLGLAKVDFLKLNFYCPDIHLSAGFLSSWLPPKISLL